MLEIKINKTSNPKEKPSDGSKLGFGKIFTDHMLMMDYNLEEGWHNAQIIPYGNIELSPASVVLHYASECFEGMKAYLDVNKEIVLFRPEENAKRFNRSLTRLCAPEINTEDFVQAVKTLVDVDREWVPAWDNTSLYIRPFMIATEETLGVTISTQYKFMIICSPSGAYHSNNLVPTKIFVEDTFIRAAEGGTGDVKVGGNYAAGLKGQKKASDLGYSQVLWLDAKENKYIEEVGSMNVFFMMKNKIYTAPTTGTILPGITRMSCIALLKAWGYEVIEVKYSIDEVFAAYQAGQLQEVFGTGTAAVITPIGQLYYKGEEIIVNDGNTGELTMKLFQELTNIQLGKAEDKYNWITKV